MVLFGADTSFLHRTALWLTRLKPTVRRTASASTSGKIRAGGLSQRDTLNFPKSLHFWHFPFSLVVLVNTRGVPQFASNLS
jgi:hypothetical protein